MALDIFFHNSFWHYSNGVGISSWASESGVTGAPTWDEALSSVLWANTDIVAPLWEVDNSDSFWQDPRRQQFIDWAAANNIVVGRTEKDRQWGSPDAVLWSLFNANTGKPIGKPVRVLDNTTVMDLMSPIILAVTAGAGAAWTVGAQVAAGVTDNPNIGAAVKIAKIVSGNVDFGEVGNTGVAQVDDFDFGVGSYTDFDYGNFDSFDFSDGEAFTAFSDAQNVDYGFGGYMGDFSGADTVLDRDLSGDNYGHEGMSYGTTGETTVNNYGTLFDGNFFTGDNIKSLSQGVSVAAQVGKAVSGNVVKNQQTATGGGTKFSQTATNAASIIAQANAQSQGSSPSILSSIGGLLKQVETIIPKTYTGQLGANKSGAAAQQNSNLLLIGGGLIAVALLLHFKD